jgi:hypothetical protein
MLKSRFRIKNQTPIRRVGKIKKIKKRKKEIRGIASPLFKTKPVGN